MRSDVTSFGIVCTTAATFVVEPRRCPCDSAFFVPAPPLLAHRRNRTPLKPSRPFERKRMRTLVLNAGYEPLAVVSFKRALVLVMNDKATVVERVDDNPIWGTAGVYDRPAVILLTRYVRIPGGRRVPVTRRGVLRRDGHRCAYCAKPATTIDHIQPRSRGGGDSWENLVACCLRCNNQKGDRTPQEMGWELRWAPLPPHGSQWRVRGTDRTDPVWEPYLALAA